MKKKEDEKKKVAKVNGQTIFAEGEVTGHAHRCADKTVTLYETANGDREAISEGDFTVTHEEHNAVTMPAGEYNIGIVQEFDPHEKVNRAIAD